jgi:hypothetical protein
MNPTRLLLLAVCLFGLSAFIRSDSAQTEPTPTPPATPGQHVGPKGRHSAIRAAIMALERAKAEMQAAAHDFGGHRVEALAACDTAIAQLRLALQYANANPSGPETTPTPTTQ